MNDIDKIVVIVLFFAFFMVMMACCDCVCIKGRPPRDPAMEDMLRQHVDEFHQYEGRRQREDRQQRKNRQRKTRPHKTFFSPFSLIGRIIIAISTGSRKLRTALKAGPQVDLEAGDERMRLTASINFIMLGSRSTINDDEIPRPQESRPPAYRGRYEEIEDNDGPSRFSISSRPPSYHAGARPVAVCLQTPPPVYIA